MSRALFLAGLIGCMSWSPAFAQAQAEFPEDPPPNLYTDPPHLDLEPPPPRHFTLSISPIHLLNPVLELQAEFRLMPELGVALLGGFGNIGAEASSGDQLHFHTYEVGTQVVYYPSDDFRGIQLGVEVLYMHVNVEDEIGNERVSALGAGVTVGPFLGYKWISEPGFSVFIQGGFSVAVFQAEAKNDLGQSAQAKHSDLFLLLNINLGWSF